MRKFKTVETIRWIMSVNSLIQVCNLKLDLRYGYILHCRVVVSSTVNNHVSASIEQFKVELRKVR